MADRQALARISREWETRALDAEVRALVLRRAADQKVDLDAIVRELRFSASFGGGRYEARLSRPGEVFDVVGYGSSIDEATRAALRTLAIQSDKEARRARRMSSELLGELVEAVVRSGAAS